MIGWLTSVVVDGALTKVSYCKSNVGMITLVPLESSFKLGEI